MSKLPKSVSTATSRLAQVTQQFSSQAPLRQQQARMVHRGTMHKLNTGYVSLRLESGLTSQMGHVINRDDAGR